MSMLNVKWVAIQLLTVNQAFLCGWHYDNNSPAYLHITAMSKMSSSL